MRAVLVGMVAAVALGLAAGCFDPSYPQGLPCGADGECPPGQGCDDTRGICVAEGEGGGVPDGGVSPDPDGGVSPDPDGSSPAGDGGGKTLSFGEVNVGPCPMPAFKVEVVQLDEQPGLIGVDESNLFVCRDAFGSDPEIVEVDVGVTDFWFGEVFDSGARDVALATPGDEVFVVSISDDQLDVTELAGGNEGLTFVVGDDFSSNGLTDLMFATFTLQGLQQTDPGAFEVAVVNEGVPATEGTIFPDLDTNGLTDVVSVTNEGQELLVLPYPHTSIATRQIDVGGGVGTGHLAVTRSAADALPDVIADVEGGIVVYGNIEGELSEGIHFDLDAGGPLASGDLDGDGADEVVGVNGAGDIVIYGRDGIEPKLIDALGFDPGVPVRGLAIGDPDADGLPDILVATDEGMFWYPQLPE